MSGAGETGANSRKDAPHTGSPLRRRFIAGIGLMLLPFLVLSVTGYMLFRDVMGSFQEIKVEAFDELSPVLRIQILMQKAAMPPNDYLITGDRGEERHFHQLAAEVDRAFETAFRLPFKLDQEKDLVRAAIAARSVPVPGGKTVSVTVSLGVAAYPGDADTAEKLISAADKALYRAKRSGRNRTERYEGEHA